MKAKEIIERHLEQIREQMEFKKNCIREAEGEIEKWNQRIEELKETEAALQSHLSISTGSFVCITGDGKVLAKVAEIIINKSEEGEHHVSFEESTEED